MSVWEKIQGVINERKQKKIEQSVEEMESIYKDTETKEEGIREIAEIVMRQINSNPELAGLIDILLTPHRSRLLPSRSLRQYRPR